MFFLKTFLYLVQHGALGILGPTSQESSLHVQSICDAKEIPLVETRIDGQSKHHINLHPSPEDLGRAYLDIINEFNWHGFTILYEDSPWLELVEYIMTNYKKKYPIYVQQLRVTADSNYRVRLSQVKKFQPKNLVLCSSIEKLPNILMQAQQVGLLTDDRHVLITSLDMHTIDLEPYQYSGTLIVGFRLLNVHDPDFKELARQLGVFAERNTHLHRPRENQNLFSRNPRDFIEEDSTISEGLTGEKMKVSTALTYDAGKNLLFIKNIYYYLLKFLTICSFQ